MLHKAAKINPNQLPSSFFDRTSSRSSNQSDSTKCSQLSSNHPSSQSFSIFNTPNSQNYLYKNPFPSSITQSTQNSIKPTNHRYPGPYEIPNPLLPSQQRMNYEGGFPRFYGPQSQEGNINKDNSILSANMIRQPSFVQG